MLKILLNYMVVPAVTILALRFCFKNGDKIYKWFTGEDL